MAVALALIFSYMLCIIVAGHGIAPLGLLMFLGGLDSWFIAGKSIGWIGLACLLIATFRLQQKSMHQLVLQLVSAILLYASWFDIARRTDNESGSFFTTFIFSIPFQITFLVAVVWLAFEIKLVRQGSSRAP
jgi:hypothetical protein